MKKKSKWYLEFQKSSEIEHGGHVDDLDDLPVVPRKTPIRRGRRSVPLVAIVGAVALFALAIGAHQFVGWSRVVDSMIRFIIQLMKFVK